VGGIDFQFTAESADKDKSLFLGKKKKGGVTV
jgi:hypothetical protein